MDKEVWKDVEGYEGCYQVSNFGKVKGLDRKDSRGKNIKGIILKSHLSTCGHLRVYLYKGGKSKPFFVHRLVASAFIPPAKLEVNHINGVKTDNRVKNLEWCTRSENARHAYKTGLAKPLSGENCPTAKFTNEQAEEIRKEYHNGVKTSYSKLAKKYNVGTMTIYRIVNYHRYKT